MLQSRGFKILSINQEIISNKEKVAEVDLIVEGQKGERYAVEIKSGNGDVSSIRQAYANANLCGYRPMLLCKGFSDSAAKEAASSLGVEVIKFSDDYLILEPEELESIVKKCVEEVFEEYGFLPYQINLDDESRKILRSISTSDSFSKAADILGINEKEMGKKLGDLSKKGILPKRSLSFNDLKRCCSSILARGQIIEKLDELKKEIRKMKRK
jgi:predicted RecB family endonuclease